MTSCSPALSPQVQSFGTSLRRRRKELGLSQQDLAAKSGVAAASISHIECLDWGPTLDVAVRLAGAADTTVGALLGEVSGE